MIAELILALVVVAWLSAYAVTDLVRFYRRRHRATLTAGQPARPIPVPDRSRGAA